MREEEIITDAFACNGVMVKQITSVWKPNGEQSFSVLTEFGEPVILITADERRESTGVADLRDLITDRALKASEESDA